METSPGRCPDSPGSTGSLGEDRLLPRFVADPLRGFCAPDQPSPTGGKFAPGAVLQSLGPAIMRQTEAPDSLLVECLPSDAKVVVISTLPGARCMRVRMLADKMEGWVKLSSGLDDQPLWQQLDVDPDEAVEESISRADDAEPQPVSTKASSLPEYDWETLEAQLRAGMLLESIGPTIMRECEALDSPEVARILPDVKVEVLSTPLGPTCRRILVRDVQDGQQGWVSLRSGASGPLLWRRVDSAEPAQDAVDRPAPRIGEEKRTPTGRVATFLSLQGLHSLSSPKASSVGQDRKSATHSEPSLLAGGFHGAIADGGSAAAAAAIAAAGEAGPESGSALLRHEPRGQGRMSDGSRASSPKLGMEPLSTRYSPGMLLESLDTVIVRQAEDTCGAEEVARLLADTLVEVLSVGRTGLYVRVALMEEEEGWVSAATRDGMPLWEHVDAPPEDQTRSGCSQHTLEGEHASQASSGSTGGFAAEAPASHGGSEFSTRLESAEFVQTREAHTVATDVIISGHGANKFDVRHGSVSTIQSRDVEQAHSEKFAQLRLGLPERSISAGVASSETVADATIMRLEIAETIQMTETEQVLEVEQVHSERFTQMHAGMQGQSLSTGAASTEIVTEATVIRLETIETTQMTEIDQVVEVEQVHSEQATQMHAGMQGQSFSTGTSMTMLLLGGYNEGRLSPLGCQVADDTARPGAPAPGGVPVFTPEGYRAQDGAWLGGADASRFAAVDRPQSCGVSEPAFAAGFEELLAAAPELEPQSVNLVKKCPACGKPGAVNMPTCNGCGASLQHVPVSTTSNLFVGMIFGVAKAPFPLKISLRAETPTQMVFDDPLAMSRAHVLAVPTDVYVPDIRTLFAHPKPGLALVERLEQAAWDALAAGPLSDAAWRRKALSARGNAKSMEELRGCMVKGFNLPPSQYQIHLQYMLPPLLPSHFVLWKRGAHFTKLRYFPYVYVVAALRALIAANEPLKGAPEMTAPEIVQALENYGVDYERVFSRLQEEVAENNACLANFDPGDFSYAVVGDTVCAKSGSEPLPDAPTAKEVEGADRLALQGYGRPYDADGKPAGVYYSHTRAPQRLPWLEASLCSEGRCLDAAPNARYKLGMLLKSLGPTIMRDSEALDSSVASRLPPETLVEVLSVGTGPTGKRVLVRSVIDRRAGWVSVVAGGDEATSNELWREVEVTSEINTVLHRHTVREAHDKTERLCNSLFGQDGREGMQGRPNVRYGPGALLESIGPVIMRAAEALESPVVAQLPAGTQAKVLLRGSGPTGKRVFVRTMDRQEGWVSIIASNGAALWHEVGTASSPSSPSAPSSPAAVAVKDAQRVVYDVGTLLESAGTAIMRADVAFESAFVGQVAANTLAEVVVSGSGPSSNRVLVRIVDSRQEGWVSIIAATGAVLWRPTGAHRREAGRDAPPRIASRERTREARRPAALGEEVVTGTQHRDPDSPSASSDTALSHAAASLSVVRDLLREDCAAAAAAEGNQCMSTSEQRRLYLQEAQALGLNPQELQETLELEALGFEYARALEAYLACERHKEMAAHFLLAQQPPSSPAAT